MENDDFNKALKASERRINKRLDDLKKDINSMKLDVKKISDHLIPDFSLPLDDYEKKLDLIFKKESE